MARKDVEISTEATISRTWVQGRAMTDWLRDSEKLAHDCVQMLGAPPTLAGRFKLDDTRPWKQGDVSTAVESDTTKNIRWIIEERKQVHGQHPDEGLRALDDAVRGKCSETSNKSRLFRTNRLVTCQTATHPSQRISHRHQRRNSLPHGIRIGQRSRTSLTRISQYRKRTLRTIRMQYQALRRYADRTNETRWKISENVIR
jgi:hypothetical protein